MARTCNLILIVLDVLKPLGHKKLIEHELEGFGIRLNKQPPNIGFKKKDKGGINFTTTVGLSCLWNAEATKNAEFVQCLLLVYLVTYLLLETLFVWKLTLGSVIGGIWFFIYSKDTCRSADLEDFIIPCFVCCEAFSMLLSCGSAWNYTHVQLNSCIKFMYETITWLLLIIWTKSIVLFFYFFSSWC